MAGTGIAAFDRGMWPNLLKVVPAMSVSFVTFDQARRALVE